MAPLAVWVHRRLLTICVATFFVLWYAVQLSVFHWAGEDVAVWWFYFQAPPDLASPGTIFAPISHDMSRWTHLGGNVLILALAGGVAEPHIGRDRILVLVFGLGYFGTYLANATAMVHLHWMFAGASGGILSLWAYTGLRMRNRAWEDISDGVKLARRSVETMGALLLLLGIPVLLLHQTLWVSPPHSGHAIGLVLGCLYYLVEPYLEP